MPATRVQIEEIRNFAVRQPIEQIAQCPANNGPVASPLAAKWRAPRKPEDEDRHNQRDHKKNDITMHTPSASNRLKLIPVLKPKRRSKNGRTESPNAGSVRAHALVA